MPLRTTLISKWYYFIGILCSYFAPIWEITLAVGVLILIDTVFGVIGACKQGVKINSRRLSDTLIKMLVYQLLIVSGFIIETTLVHWIPFTKVIITFIAITEILSIGENFTKITGLPFISYLREVIKGHLKNGKVRKEIDKKKE